MRVMIDFNEEGTKLEGELLFTGPCARLEGNKVLEALKKIQKENNFKGEVSESYIGYVKRIHTIYDEDVIVFNGTDEKSIIEKILELNKKRFPDKKINVSFFHDEDADTVVISEEEIPDQIEKDYHQKTLLINDSEVKIDENLFEFIKELNEKGYPTLYCCAGHKTVNDGKIEIMDGKGYSTEKFIELFPELDHGEKTIMFRSTKSLISTGYIVFEYNDKTLDLFKRLEKDCSACRNGEKEFGIDNQKHINFPCLLNRDSFSDEEVFYTEYPEEYNGKKRLILRWNQTSSFKVLMKIQDCIRSFL